MRKAGRLAGTRRFRLPVTWVRSVRRGGLSRGWEPLPFTPLGKAPGDHARPGASCPSSRKDFRFFPTLLSQAAPRRISPAPRPAKECKSRVTSKQGAEMYRLPGERVLGGGHTVAYGKIPAGSGIRRWMLYRCDGYDT